MSADNSPQMDATQPIRRADDLPPSATWFERWMFYNWRAICKEISTWVFGLIGFLAFLAECMPLWVPSAKEFLSGHALHGTIFACVIGGLLAKFYKQRNLP